ncbi:MAG: hypothetical protein UW18_C0011G0009 [Microgenomates group bacterium GW2011_GWF1_44_10]|nr:MAG: hypothetical protein UW18_C0011G0009 [Microgenomates group bacterium GW2011_GWF1_44_10]
MATFNKFNSFVEALAEKAHNLGSDTLNVTFTAAAAAPVATNTVLGDLTQITLTYVDSQALTISTSAQTDGTYKLVLADKTVTATGGTVGPFRYVVIYNDTAASDELIGWYDYGSEITLAAGESLTINFDGTNGVLTIA